MDAPGSPLSWSGCVRAMGRRMATLWWVKMPGTMVGIAGFFAAYFWVLEHPFFPVTVLPPTAIDRLIPFSGWMLWVYLSLWFYVGLLPALAKDRRELVAYVGPALALSGVGLAIFMVWPTAVAVRGDEWSGHVGFVVLAGVDATGNACPSLHVAFAVLTAIGIRRVLRDIGAGVGWSVANWVWCAAISYSTVAIRQHVVIDVIAGALLGAAVGLVVPRTGRRKKVG